MYKLISMNRKEKVNQLNTIYYRLFRKKHVKTRNNFKSVEDQRILHNQPHTSLNLTAQDAINFRKGN